VEALRKREFRLDYFSLGFVVTLRMCGSVAET
jgi:hypothetical protein